MRQVSRGVVLRWAAAALAASAVLTTVSISGGSAAGASTLLGGLLPLAPTTTTTTSAAPLLLNWATLLPSLTDAYDPNSANDCVAGRPNCVDLTIKEMERRFDPMATACNDNAVFSLAYLRTTMTYEWARNQPGFFNDTPWVNHEDAVFAKYYFSAFDNYASGNMAAVPQAWQIAFSAARSEQVSGTGNLLLGMSAHVNRDLPYVLAAISITYPDGTTRKPDHDQVNAFLNDELVALLAEDGQRFDPGINPNVMWTPYGLGYAGLFQTLVVWREQAWRNAELLTDAPDAAARALVSQQIEATAAAEAQLIVAGTAYPPIVGGAATRDAYCAVHHGDSSTVAYPWGYPTP
jgi:hypothetical protein